MRPFPAETPAQTHSETPAESSAEVRPLLSVRDLRIAFGGQEAVRGISFDIAPGETLGLVGESGSGKSLTSLAVLRLLPAQAVVSGRILLDETRAALQDRRAERDSILAAATSASSSADFAAGSGPGSPPGDITSRSQERGFAAADLLTLPERQMRAHRGLSVAMIFQEPMTALNPVMSVGRQIAEAVLAHAPRTSRRALRERVLAAMHEVALPDPERRLGDYPHQFSGGQRQRIVIAMALINRPRVLIADEPTTALDVTVQAQILDLLRRLRASHGLTLLFISHDLAVVGSIADRIAVMRQGALVEQGSTRQILTAPQHAYTQRLLASAATMRTPRDRPLATL